MTDSGDTITRPRVGILVFDGVKLLDFVGPAEVFHEASHRSPGYEVVLISVGGGEVTSSMGAIRLDIAVSRLECGASVNEAATTAGYRSPVSPRRAFVSRFGITPSECQKRFQTSRSGEVA